MCSLAHTPLGIKHGRLIIFLLLMPWPTWRGVFTVIMQEEGCQPSILLPKSESCYLMKNPLIDDGINVWDFVIGTWYFVAYGGHLHVVSLMELEADMVP